MLGGSRLSKMIFRYFVIFNLWFLVFGCPHSKNPHRLLLKQVDRETYRVDLFPIRKDRSVVVRGNSGELSEGFKMEVDPFTFNYSGQIEIKKSTEIVDSTLFGLLQLSKAAHFIPGSRAWRFSTSMHINRGKEIKIRLPIDPLSDGHKFDSGLKLVLVYSVNDDRDGHSYIGIIPNQEISKTQSFAQFKAWNEGTFQFAYSDIDVEEQYQVKLGMPVFLDKEGSKDQVILTDVHLEQEKRRAMVSISSPESLLGCVVIKDRDKMMPYDWMGWSTNLMKLSVKATRGSADHFFIRAVCKDRNGQSMYSSWSEENEILPIHLELQHPPPKIIYQDEFRLDVITDNAVAYQWSLMMESREGLSLMAIIVEGPKFFSLPKPESC